MKFLVTLSTMFLLMFGLTACGGGSSSTNENLSVVPTQFSKLIFRDSFLTTSASQYYAPVYQSAVEGNFKGDGSHYVLLAGWLSGDAPRDVKPAVKIYKLNTDGSGEDATIDILGQEFNWSVNIPVVADFNGDGKDDIALMGFTDAPAYTDNASVVFLSQHNSHHIQVSLNDPGTWNHGVTAGDIDVDGDIDIINSEGQVWKNDGSGSFTFKNHSWTDSPGYWMHGAGVCIADFNGKGKPQILITDVYNESDLRPIQDTILYEVDASLNPVSEHRLPVPIMDRQTTVSDSEVSHDVSCLVEDLNNDGLLDVLVSSASHSWKNEKTNRIQLYINKGNYEFIDITENAFVENDQTKLATYFPVAKDLNDDGNMDVIMTNFDTPGSSPNAQYYINNGDATFRRVAYDDINSSMIDFYSKVGSSSDRPGLAMPIKFGDTWNIFLMGFSNWTENRAFVGQIALNSALD